MQSDISPETLIVQLRAHHERALGFRDRAATGTAHPQELLPEALTELSTAVEELRVTEEHLQRQSDVLEAAQDQLERDRRHYQQLFEHAPDALLVTDGTGVILEANHAAAALLGRGRWLLGGMPLSSFLNVADTWDFLGRLRRMAAERSVHTWRLELRPRDGDTVGVDARVVAAPEDSRHPGAVWWSLRPIPGRERPAALATQPPVEAIAEAAGAVDSDVRLTLQQVVETATATFRASGAGVMLLDEQLSLRWMTTSSAQSRALEGLQAELGEGPCLEAFLHEEPVSTSDLVADARWPRLGPKLAEHHIHAALCAPVSVRGTPVGTVNVFRDHVFTWSPADLGAVRAYAALVARLLAAMLDARQRGVTVDQLQHALDVRVLVEQAKGVLMERDGVSAAGAWRQIRQTARGQRRTVVQVAREIIGGGPEPMV